MKLSREMALNLVVAALLGLGALWLVVATEWVDVWRVTPPRGDADIAARQHLVAGMTFSSSRLS